MLIPSITLNGAGGILKREIDSRGWSQSDFAEITGLSVKTINQIINNKQTLTADVAILFGRVFDDIPAEFWMNLDAKYQINQKLQNEQEKVDFTKLKADLHKIMPFTEIKKKGWFNSSMKNLEESKIAIRNLFNSDEIPEILIEKACARRTKKENEYTDRNCNAWYFFAKHFAKDFILPNYNKNEFVKICQNISFYTLKENGVELFLNDLNSVGVGFLMLTHLEKTYLDGAAFFVNEKPFVAYTGRYNRIDNFWFTIAHECSHIINDFEFLKEGGATFDDFELKDETDEKEIRADNMANEFLHHDKVRECGVMFGKYLSKERLDAISKSCGVSVPVAVGMLQHDNILDWRQFSKLRETVIDKIPEGYKRG